MKLDLFRLDSLVKLAPAPHTCEFITRPPEPRWIEAFEADQDGERFELLSVRVGNFTVWEGVHSLAQPLTLPQPWMVSPDLELKVRVRLALQAPPTAFTGRLRSRSEA